MESEKIDNLNPTKVQILFSEKNAKEEFTIYDLRFTIYDYSILQIVNRKSSIVNIRQDLYRIHFHNSLYVIFFPYINIPVR
jgi:hypothetical protein